MKKTIILLLVAFLVTSIETKAQVRSAIISNDDNGRTFVAGRVNITENLAALFHNIDNTFFTCTPVKQLQAGDVIALRLSSDRAWSISTMPLLIGTNKVDYPIFSSVKPSDGKMIVILPAVLMFKKDIKAGAVLHSEGQPGFNITTERSIKAGDSISVFYLNGPSILSIETAETGNEVQPWFTAYVDNIDSNDVIGMVKGWQLENEYVSPPNFVEIEKTLDLKRKRFNDAVKGGYLNLVKDLLKENPNLVFSKDDDLGDCPLHMAVMQGDKNMVELLLANRAD